MNIIIDIIINTNKYFPCPVKGCVSEVFAFVFDKYDNELKHLILCTSNTSDKRAKKVPNWELNTWDNSHENKTTHLKYQGYLIHFKNTTFSH